LGAAGLFRRARQFQKLGALGLFESELARRAAFQDAQQAFAGGLIAPEQAGERFSAREGGCGKRALVNLHGGAHAAFSNR
jgi:hypothetical protein